MADPEGKSNGAKSDDFDARLSKAQQVQAAKQRPSRSNDGAAMGVGMRLSVELVVATLIGGLIGWGLDHLIGSQPWLLMLFVLLGAAAGVKNMLRAMAEIDTARERKAAEAAQKEKDAGS